MTIISPTAFNAGTSGAVNSASTYRRASSKLTEILTFPSSVANPPPNSMLMIPLTSKYGPALKSIPLTEIPPKEVLKLTSTVVPLISMPGMPLTRAPTSIAMEPAIPLSSILNSARPVVDNPKRVIRSPANAPGTPIVSPIFSALISIAFSAPPVWTSIWKLPIVNSCPITIIETLAASRLKNGPASIDTG